MQIGSRIYDATQPTGDFKSRAVIKYDVLCNGIFLHLATVAKGCESFLLQHHRYRMALQQAMHELFTKGWCNAHNHVKNDGPTRHRHPAEFLTAAAQLGYTIKPGAHLKHLGNDVYRLCGALSEVDCCFRYYIVGQEQYQKVARLLPHYCLCDTPQNN